MLYTDCQSGRTAAIMHHVSFAQITCCLSICFAYSLVLIKQNVKAVLVLDVFAAMTVCVVAILRVFLTGLLLLHMNTTGF